MSNLTYLYRNAIHSDLSTLVDFGAQVGRDSYIKTGFLPAEYVNGPQRTYWTAEYLQSVIENEKGLLLVVLDGDELIGMTEVEQFGDDDAIMWKLYIHHDYQGKGVGSRLLQEIIDRLPPNVCQLKTEYYDSNVPAAQFYKAKGFTFLESKLERFRVHEIPYTYVSKSLDK